METPEQGGAAQHRPTLKAARAAAGPQTTSHTKKRKLWEGETATETQDKTTEIQEETGQHHLVAATLITQEPFVCGSAGTATFLISFQLTGTSAPFSDGLDGEQTE